MRCIGRTKTEFKRCSNTGKLKYLGFCNKHKLQSLLTFFTIITVIGTIGGIFQDIIFPLNNFNNGKFEIADIEIIKTDTFPSLDIKLQNNTNNPIFIYEIECKTINSWHLKSWIDYSYEPSSFTYTLFLKEGKNEISKIKTSQTIKPKGVDRFSIIVGGESKSWRGYSPYLFNLKLNYGENKSLISKNILINIPVQGVYHGAYNPGPTSEIVQYNYETSKIILKELDASTIADSSLIKLIKYYSEIDSVKFKNKISE